MTPKAFLRRDFLALETLFFGSTSRTSSGFSLRSIWISPTYGDFHLDHILEFCFFGPEMPVALP